MAADIGAGRGSDRILAKLKANVESGQYYEAHQMYRTLYFRHMGQKKYKEAFQLLYEGSRLLLEHGQTGSGADLALLLLEAMEKSEEALSAESIQRLGHLHSVIPCSAPERETFVRKAINLSNKCGCQARLHQTFASNFWKEKNLFQARYHFLHSNDGEGCGQMLVEYHMQSGYAYEVDLFIAQTVLQYLCLRNRSTATITFFTYTNKHPSIQNGPPYLLPLLNFLWFLLLAVNEGKVTVFTVLCEKYEPSLNRDPLYKQYLDKIGQLFFGIPPPTRRSGFLSSLFQSLLSGGPGSDEDFEDGDSATASDEESTGAATAAMPLPNRSWQRHAASAPDLD